LPDCQTIWQPSARQTKVSREETGWAAASGELHHALKAGLLEVGSVYGEMTAVASGRLVGRTADDELTVADLTGLGIQDAAVAALASEHGAGRDVPLGGW
jgi:ornithine cyclodeaminase